MFFEAFFITRSLSSGIILVVLICVRSSVSISFLRYDLVYSILNEAMYEVIGHREDVEN